MTFVRLLRSLPLSLGTTSTLEDLWLGGNPMVLPSVEELEKGVQHALYRLRQEVWCCAPGLSVTHVFLACRLCGSGWVSRQ